MTSWLRSDAASASLDVARTPTMNVCPCTGIPPSPNSVTEMLGPQPNGRSNRPLPRGDVSVTTPVDALNARDSRAGSMCLRRFTRAGVALVSFGLVLGACGGDEEKALRAELSALQTQVAKPTPSVQALMSIATNTPARTATPAPTATLVPPTPTSTPVPPTTTPVPTATPEPDRVVASVMACDGYQGRVNFGAACSAIVPDARFPGGERPLMTNPRHEVTVRTHTGSTYTVVVPFAVVSIEGKGYPDPPPPAPGDPWP